MHYTHQGIIKIYLVISSRYPTHDSLAISSRCPTHDSLVISSWHQMSHTRLSGFFVLASDVPHTTLWLFRPGIRCPTHDSGYFVLASDVPHTTVTIYQMSHTRLSGHFVQMSHTRLSGHFVLVSDIPHISCLVPALLMIRGRDVTWTRWQAIAV